MPTLACQPSLKSTQAVGALLMHQFARDRFIQAGIDEQLIQEAELKENLNKFVEGVVDNDLSIDDSGRADLSCSSNFHHISDESHTRPDTSEYHSINNDTLTIPSFNNGSGLPRSPIQLDQEQPEIEESSRVKLRKNLSRKFESMQSNPSMRIYGQQLRQLAEEFERDRKRQIVRDSANKVELADITKENFMKLLEELFQDRVTREKIVVLFFFCTDVALRAASFAQELVVQLMSWSFSYIVNIVCRAVYYLGGWDHVLFRQLPSITVTCCAMLGIFALLVFLRKSLLT